MIAELSRRLADYDSSALDYLVEVAGNVRALFPDQQFKEFRKLVEDYAFEDALDKLTAAAARQDSQKLRS